MKISKMKAVLLATDDFKFLEILKKKKESIYKINIDNGIRSRSLTPHAISRNNNNIFTMSQSKCN
jgi:hypothetical protein